jgi:hypothetical protein
MTSKNPEDGKKRYMEGLDEYINALLDAKDEDQPTEKPDYRRQITMRAEAEWKLRPKQDKTNSPAKKPTTSKTPATPTTQPAPKKHGEHPPAPPGQEFYWYDYTPKAKGV